MDFDEIASELGYANRGGAHKAVERELTARLKDRPITPEDRERNWWQEMQRIDRWQAIAEKKLAEAGDLTAIDRLVKLSHHRANMFGWLGPAVQVNNQSLHLHQAASTGRRIAAEYGPPQLVEHNNADVIEANSDDDVRQ